MTQEELDALMNSDLDELAVLEEEPKTETAAEEESGAEEPDTQNDVVVLDKNNFRVDANEQWPPPPPTEDHKVVNQLDDVTRDSEKKATEIMDRLEQLNNFVMQIGEEGNALLSTLEKNIETFEKLAARFPNIEIFATHAHENRQARDQAQKVLDQSRDAEDEIMMIMDIMQYQDIHRQKIERVINVMRALSKYMSSLFESKKDDASRVSSAVHIKGDSDTADIVSEDEIEALLENFGRK